MAFLVTLLCKRGVVEIGDTAGTLIAWKRAPFSGYCYQDDLATAHVMHCKKSFVITTQNVLGL